MAFYQSTLHRATPSNDESGDGGHLTHGMSLNFPVNCIGPSLRRSESDHRIDFDRLPAWHARAQTEAPSPVPALSA